jgi:nicotinate phosphoribosyltransferase
MPAGTIVFSAEPLLRLEGPFALLQLVETPILNLLNFSSLVATNASRMHMIAAPTQCVEFGLRRAQGPNGALTASKYSMLGGFVGTSNVQAGYLYDLNIVGTLAHSMIMSYEEESDCATSKMVTPKAGGPAQDLLKMSLEYRFQLGWNT